MADVQSQPSTKSRGPPRSNRGGTSSRGRTSQRGGMNGEPRIHTKDSMASKSSVADEGELGQLKSKYVTQLGVLKDMFPDWTDEDIVYALRDSSGNLETTIEHMTQGHASHWGEVKKKDRTRSKVKEDSAAPSTDGVNGSTGRGTRGASGRGTSTAPRRGVRGADRGGRTRGGFDRAQASSTRATHSGSTTTNEENATVPFGSSPPFPVDPTSETTQLTQVRTDEDAKASTVIPQGSKKSWASMFAKPPPAPAVLKPVAVEAAPTTPERSATEESKADHASDVGMQGLPPVVAPPEEPVIHAFEPLTPGTAAISNDGRPIQGLPPPKDELTETNVAKLPDASVEPQSDTVASTIGQSQAVAPAALDPSLAPPGGGYAAVASRLANTAASSRSVSGSFKRPVLQQRESVVMPTHHTVDQTTVQFGSFGLSDSEAIEDAETRAQPPPHSPEAMPKMSLPADTRPVQPPASQTEPPSADSDWTFVNAPPASSMQGYPPSSVAHVPTTSQGSSYAPQSSDQYAPYSGLHHPAQQMHSQAIGQQSVHHQQPVHQSAPQQHSMHPLQHQQSGYQQSHEPAAGKQDDLQTPYNQYTTQSQLHHQPGAQQPQSSLPSVTGGYNAHQPTGPQSSDIAAYYAAMANPNRGGLSSPYGPQDARSSADYPSHAQQHHAPAHQQHAPAQQRSGSGMGNHFGGMGGMGNMGHHGLSTYDGAAFGGMGGQQHGHQDAASHNLYARLGQFGQAARTGSAFGRQEGGFGSEAQGSGHNTPGSGVGQQHGQQGQQHQGQGQQGQGQGPPYGSYGGGGQGHQGYGGYGQHPYGGFIGGYGYGGPGGYGGYGGRDQGQWGGR